MFKSEYTRKIIAKLPSRHHVLHTALRIEKCDGPSKIYYSLYNITPSGKHLVGSGYIQEHQWIQLTKLSDAEGKWMNLTGLDVGSLTSQAIEIEIKFTETGIFAHENEQSKIAQIDILPEFYGY